MDRRSQGTLGARGHPRPRPEIGIRARPDPSAAARAGRAAWRQRRMRRGRSGRRYVRADRRGPGGDRAIALASARELLPCRPLRPESSPRDGDRSPVSTETRLYAASPCRIPCGSHPPMRKLSPTERLTHPSGGWNGRTRLARRLTATAPARVRSVAPHARRDGGRGDIQSAGGYHQARARRRKAPGPTRAAGTGSAMKPRASYETLTRHLRVETFRGPQLGNTGDPR